MSDILKGGLIFLGVTILVLSLTIGPDLALTGHMPICADKITNVIVEKTWIETTAFSIGHYAFAGNKTMMITRDEFARIQPGQTITITQSVCKSILYGEMPSQENIKW